MKTRLTEQKDISSFVAKRDLLLETEKSDARYGNAISTFLQVVLSLFLLSGVAAILLFSYILITKQQELQPPEQFLAEGTKEAVVTTISSQLIKKALLKGHLSFLLCGQMDHLRMRL